MKGSAKNIIATWLSPLRYRRAQLASGSASSRQMSTGSRAAVLTAAMAPGVNAYLFADMYGRARRIAASSVLVATLLCILTAWLWMGLLP